MSTSATMDDVADLVLTPFRDIVDKGKTAVANAGDAQPMLKAAQQLVKEGERALKRIEPLCKKNLDEYGLNFLAALKENDDIATYRSELTELLWEFDDFIEVDDFDADKFSEIQGLSRKAAPKIYDILMRMKLEAQTSPKNEAPNFLSQLSPPSSPPLRLNSPTLPIQPPSSRSSHASLASSPLAPPPNVPLPPIPGGPVPGMQFQQPRQQRSSFASSGADSRTSRTSRTMGDMNNVADATNNLMKLTMRTGSQAGVIEYASSDTAQDAEPVEQPPRPPSTNPWDTKLRPASEERAESPIERRAPVGPDESPTLPSPYGPENERRFPRAVPRTAGARTSAQSDGSQDSEDRRRSSNSSVPVYNLFPGAPRPRAPTVNTSTVSQAIPEDGTIGSAPVVEDLPSPFSPMTTHTQSYSHHDRQSSQTISIGSEHRPSFGASDTSSTWQANAINNNTTDNPVVRINAINAITRSDSDSRSQPGLEIASNHFVTQDIDQGLIPVETESSESAPPMRVPTKDLTIRGSSSFYIHKGFCEGSKEVLRGGIGVKKTKKPVGFTTATTVARCTSCLYELDFKNIEEDVNRQAGATYTKSGIDFRLRFLQKSHLPIRRMDDIMYACVFCIQAGCTLEESDATVFFTTKTLFSHLARHPRPLPDIPGMTIIDGPEIPADLANDFDLHFTKPPQSNPVSDNATYISQQPTGTAREQARRLYGQRLLPDRTPALELAQGAKITGLEWPEHYHGDWAHGWHDGVHATVPTDILRIDPPPMGQIKMSGTSQIRAKARWKFAPKDKDKGDWLKFDKGEVITNINWQYPEHWCWSGTNAKGKWGIFPQVFIEPNSVQELSANGSDRASILSNEKNKSSGLLSRFASRKGSVRPPSIAGSSSSHETASPFTYGRS